MRDRYLVQFKDNDKDYFVTDCAYQEGQFDKARAYVDLVLSCKAANVDHGVIRDWAQHMTPIIYRAVWYNGQLHTGPKPYRQGMEGS